MKLQLNNNNNKLIRGLGLQHNLSSKTQLKVVVIYEIVRLNHSLWANTFVESNLKISCTVI